MEFMLIIIAAVTIAGYFALYLSTPKTKREILKAKIDSALAAEKISPVSVPTLEELDDLAPQKPPTQVLAIPAESKTAESSSATPAASSGFDIPMIIPIMDDDRHKQIQVHPASAPIMPEPLEAPGHSSHSHSNYDSHSSHDSHSSPHDSGSDSSSSSCDSGGCD